MLITVQDKVYAENHNVVIPETNDKNKNNSWKNIYKGID